MMRRWWSLIGLLTALSTMPAAGQVLDLMEAPWAAMADTTGRGGADVAWERGLGGEPRWRTDRLSLTFRIPVGSSALAYVRGSVVRLDVGDQPVLDRWPDRLADEPDIDPATWPGEQMIHGIGQPELGFLMPMGLPMVGPGDTALEVTLPFGNDKTYPLASRALVLRMDWRRHELAIGPVSLAARVGWEVALDASGEVYDEKAFPDGLRYGLESGTPLSADRGITVGWAARELSDGHHSRRVEASAWTTMSGGHRLRLTVLRELGARSHRMTDWCVGLAFELRRLVVDTPDAPDMPDMPQNALPPR